MTPAEQAAELCRARGGNFRDELEAHLMTGYVISTPEAFMMGRPCPRGSCMSNLWRSWPRSECDAWFVWLGVGDAGQLLSMMPFELPWIGWLRQGRDWQQDHWVRTVRLRKWFESALEMPAWVC